MSESKHELPGTNIGGCEENLPDTFVMLYNSRLLNGINWAFFFSVVGLNIFGLMVTEQLGSVFRAVLLTTRTVSVSFTVCSLLSAIGRCTGKLVLLKVSTIRQVTTSRND